MTRALLVRCALIVCFGVADFAQEAGDLIVAALEKYVAAKKEVVPKIEGRILIDP